MPLESRHHDEPAVIRHSDDPVATQIAAEQSELDIRYRALDSELAALQDDLDRPVVLDEDHLAAQAHRDAAQARAGELRRAEDGLCFGRIDDRFGSRYLGRVGLRTPAGTSSDDEPLLIDWRAPAARAFYTATAADPQGLSGRRHLQTRNRRVVGVDDERFGEGDGTAGSRGLVGEAALLRALDARRTGSMTDIVATLQAEQDAIVRAPRQGTLVVQGGPGTGKTAVALHRAAYLLFTHPRIAERGVLVVGPSSRFLEYIDQVLPALGETQVVSATCATLLPGVCATRSGSPDAERIKSRGTWVDILAEAVGRHQREPDGLTLTVAGQRISLPSATVRRAQRQAIAGRGRAEFRSLLIAELARQCAADAARELDAVEDGLEDVLRVVDAALARDRGPLEQTRADAPLVDEQQLRRTFADDPGVAEALARLWPELDPEAILHELLSDDDVLSRCAPGLTAAERATVQRDSAAVGWTGADVALLDEIAELVHLERRDDAGAGDPTGSLADRARADRRWAYGHVIVDEAQELSAMQWRMIVRRCPTLSMTVVGDVNQASAPGSHTDWDEALEPVVGQRHRRVDLTICYRTPAQVMSAAAQVLARAGSTIAAPNSVRRGEVAPWRRTVTSDELSPAVGAATRELQDRYAGGSVAVIAPEHRHRACRAQLDAEVVLLTAEASKGLEFDAVVLVDPDGIAVGPRGWNALYVAMTRCTQELGTITVGE